MNSRRFALLALAAVLGAIVYATAAPAGQQTSPSRAEFNALKARVTKDEKTTRALVGYTVACLFKYVGVARFGTPPSSGYVYDTDNNPANGQSLATALDVTDAGETPSVYVPATTNSGCLSAGTSLARRFGLRTQASRVSPAAQVLKVGTASRYGSK